MTGVLTITGAAESALVYWLKEEVGLNIFDELGSFRRKASKLVRITKDVSGRFARNDNGQEVEAVLVADYPMYLWSALGRTLEQKLSNFPGGIPKSANSYRTGDPDMKDQQIEFYQI